jgi:hypothetical protein
MFRCGYIALVSLIVTSALSPKIANAIVRVDETCEGLAIVSPPGSDAGTIYWAENLTLIKRRDGGEEERLPRRGYLPSGTIINLQEPANAKSTRSTSCGFRFRNAISGHVDKSAITRLDKVINAAHMSADEVIFIFSSKSE